MLDSPIFVVGQARGGTTLARDVLRAHPGIDGSFGESHFFQRYYDKYGDLRIDKNLVLLLNDFFETFFFKETGLDPEAIRSLIHNGERTYRDVLATIMSEFTKQASAARWVEKSPDHLMHVETILDLFPEAQVLHVVRDVRDVACSVLKRRDKGGVFSDSERLRQIISVSLSWQDRVKMGWFHEGSLDQRTYMIIKYEDLIKETEEMLVHLSEFLCLNPPLTEEMLDHAASSMKSTLAKPWSSFGDEGKGLIEAPIGRYERYLSTDEVASIELIAGPTMKASGYGVGHTPISRRGRAKLIAYLIRYPKNACRYVRGLWEYRSPF